MKNLFLLFVLTFLPLSGFASNGGSTYECWVSGGSFALTQLALPPNTQKKVVSIDSNFELAINNYEGVLLIGLRGVKDAEEISAIGRDFHVNRPDLSVNLSCLERTATEPSHSSRSRPRRHGTC